MFLQAHSRPTLLLVLPLMHMVCLAHILTPTVEPTHNQDTQRTHSPTNDSPDQALSSLHDTARTFSGSISTAGPDQTVSAASLPVGIAPTDAKHRSFNASVVDAADVDASSGPAVSSPSAWAPADAPAIDDTTADTLARSIGDTVHAPNMKSPESQAASAPAMNASAIEAPTTNLGPAPDADALGLQADEDELVKIVKTMADSKVDFVAVTNGTVSSFDQKVNTTVNSDVDRNVEYPVSPPAGASVESHRVSPMNSEIQHRRMYPMADYPAPADVHYDLPFLPPSTLYEPPQEWRDQSSSKSVSFPTSGISWITSTADTNQFAKLYYEDDLPDMTLPPFTHRPTNVIHHFPAFYRDVRQAMSESGTRWMGLPFQQIPDPHLSCKDRCGDQSTASMDREWTVVFDCYCDYLCPVMGDCCQDAFLRCQNLTTGLSIFQYLFVNAVQAFEAVVPSHWFQFTFNYENLQPAVLAYYGSCYNVTYLENGFVVRKQVQLIDKCVSSFHGNDIIEFCRNGPTYFLFSFPVSHRWDLRFTFKNVFCAVCNNIEFSDILFWKVRISCDSKQTVDKSRVLFQDLLRLSTDPACFPYTFPLIPPGARPRLCSKRHARCKLGFGAMETREQLSKSSETSGAESELDLDLDLHHDQTLQDLIHTAAENSQATTSSPVSLISRESTNGSTFDDEETEYFHEEENGEEEGENTLSYASVEIEKLCYSYFSPVQYEETLFANPHCAICGYNTPTQILQHPPQSRRSHSESDRQPMANYTHTISEITFENGELLYSVESDEGIQVWTSEAACPDGDIMSQLFPSCVKTVCPKNGLPRRCGSLGLLCGLHPVERECAAKHYRYTGNYTTLPTEAATTFYFTYFIPGDAFIMELITEELFPEAVQDTLLRHCNCHSPPRYEFYSLRREARQPDVWVYTIKWFPGQHAVLPYAVHLKYYVNRFLPFVVDDVQVENFLSEDDLCVDKSSTLLTVWALTSYIGPDLFLSTLYFDCFFEVRRVGFKAIVSYYGTSYESTFFLCWNKDLLHQCAMHNTSTGFKETHISDLPLSDQMSSLTDRRDSPGSNSVTSLRRKEFPCIAVFVGVTLFLDVVG